MATLYLRDVLDPLQRRFKLLCATRGLSIRAEVSRLIDLHRQVCMLAPAMAWCPGLLTAPPRRRRLSAAGAPGSLLAAAASRSRWRCSLTRQGRRYRCRPARGSRQNPAPRTLPSPTGHLLISQPLLGLECSTYPPASITRSPHPHPLYRHLLRVDSCMRHRSHFVWILR